jgi:hypothetical protein
MVGDASEHTRFIRMSATIAPYVTQNQGAIPNLLGWRSMQARRDVGVIMPILGAFKSFVPNR